MENDCFFINFSLFKEKGAFAECRPHKRPFSLMAAVSEATASVTTASEATASVTTVSVTTVSVTTAL